MVSRSGHTGFVQPTALFAIEARRQLEAGLARQAIETCKRGLARYPEHAAAYVVLAAAYRSLGQEQRARLVLNRGYARTGVSGLLAELNGGIATRESERGLGQTDERAEPSIHETPEPAVDETVEPDAQETVELDAVETGELDTVETGELDAVETVALHADEMAELGVDEIGELGVDETGDAKVAGSVDSAASNSAAAEEPSSEQPPAARETSEVERKIAEPAQKPQAPSLHLHDRPAGRGTPAWFPRLKRADSATRTSNLALHSALGAHRIRSANLRLIPGLEFAPLRHEEPAARVPVPREAEPPLPDWGLPGRRAAAVAGAPPGSRQHPPAVAESAAQHGAFEIRTTSDERPGPPMSPDEPTSPIEQLARRLEGARIPPIAEATSRTIHAFEPSIVSDTLAEILESQGAYAEALKALQTLARMRPERVTYYEEQIARLRQMIAQQRDAPE